MAKKRTSGSGMRVIMRSKPSDSGTPTRCCSTSSVNSAAIGWRRLARDDGKALDQRQARLDAAHDDVDRVGELVDELDLPPPGEPRRGSSAAGPRCRRMPRARAPGSAGSAPTRRCRGPPCKPARCWRSRRCAASISRPARSRRRRRVTLARAFSRCSSSSSVSATWRLRFCVDFRLHLADAEPRPVLGDALYALVRAPLAGEVRIDQQIDDRGNRQRPPAAAARRSSCRCYPRASPLPFASALASACARRSVSS